MKETIFSKYSSWQTNLLDVFWESKENDKHFIEKMSELHPKLLANKEKPTKKLDVASSLLLRMKNYGRQSNNELIQYERSPYLDDLFALCEAKGITPNDILLRNISCVADNIKNCNDVYSLIQKTHTGNKLFELFEISDINLHGTKASLPCDNIFKIILIKLLLGNLSDTFILKKDSLRFDLNTSRLEELLKITIPIIKDFVPSKTVKMFCEQKDFIEYLYGYQDWDFNYSTGFGNQDELGHYSVWDEKKQLIITLNDYIFITAIKATSEWLTIFKDTDKVNPIRLYIDFLTVNYELKAFLANMLNNSFIKINQQVGIGYGCFIYGESLEREDEELKKYKNISYSCTYNDEDNMEKNSLDSFIREANQR